MKSSKNRSVREVALLALVITLGNSFTVLASNQSPPEQQVPKPAVGTSSGGEYTSFILDGIIAEVRQTGSIIITISSLGTGDTRPSLHKRRLHNAVARLVDYQNAIPRKQVVTAMGDQIKGSGKVEFYVGGRLEYIVLFKPNADFTMDCCDEEYPNYYPWYREPNKKTRLGRNAS